MTLEDIHAMLVEPICALEEYIEKDGNPSSIVCVIAFTLRKILDEIETETMKKN